ncbi:MAG: TrmH family RNA methyltransferase [Acidobacteriota bacterium]
MAYIERMDTEAHISKAKLKFVRSLSQKKVREEESLFVIEGWRAIEDACAAGMKARMFLHTAEAAEDAHFRSVFTRAAGLSGETFEVSVRELETVTETVTPQGVAMVLPKFSHDLHGVLSRLNDEAPHIIVALDRVSEPGNAGTIIRTADWFGADLVLLSEESVGLFNPKVVRSTMGSLFHLPIIECARSADDAQSKTGFLDALRLCHEAGFSLFGADVNGAADLRTVRWPKKSLIVIGNEAHGLSSGTADVLDARIMIPKFGKAESLNAATAAAVMLGAVRLSQT